MNGATQQREWIDEQELVAIGPFARSYWAQRRTKKAKAPDSGPPFYKVGRCVVYKRSEVEEWLARHRVDPTLGSKERDKAARAAKERRP